MGYYMFLFTLLCLITKFVISTTDTNLETYIVHVELPSTSTLSSDLQGWYQTFLPSTSSTTVDEEPRILYSYHNVFKGFAARLSPDQVKAMENKPGFISAKPQKTISLHTTHSPNFLGLNQNTGFWQDSNYGKGIIIGVLDSGINPFHPSFGDEGMPPPPARWRGTCQLNTMACNNKLIGARYFTIGNGTALDENGHGTHTASTATGNFVRGANVFGNANGTAAGIAPLAHLAIYKVCDETSCSEIDIMAAMDAAIDDGVDILSLSLGSTVVIDNFYSDNIAMGAFSAVMRGIFASASAGNYGPVSGTILNGAPWILTVGASTTDRRIRATAVLGNGEQLDGESAFQPSDFPSTLLPLVYGELCLPTSLSNVDVRGRIVLCEFGNIENIAKGQAVRNAGGAAMILINPPSQGYTVYSDAHVIPATHLSYADALRVAAYFNSTSSPTATISFKGTIIGDDRAPAVAAYSARGPNLASPLILKPDIIGPGQNILAAWHISVENNPNTIFNFNIIYGTSMACPHLSGIAALLKNVHPDWSPAVIKSAIMTSADQVNLGGNPIEDQNRRPANFLDTGSGHVNILRATDPGLVYDIRPEDYLPYLCGLGYTDRQVGMIAGRAVRCLDIGRISETELNYPSFSLILGKASQTYKRTVTNVGEAGSVYTAVIAGLAGVHVRVEPTTLQFSGTSHSLTYQVTFRRLATARGNTTVQGFLTWTSAGYSVRSPVHVGFN